MTKPRPMRLLTRDTHTTDLPSPVVREVLQLLETGTILERMRAAQLLATAYADDEARRLAEADAADAAEDAVRPLCLAAPTEPGETGE